MAAPVKLAWAASSDPAVVGYAVCYGLVGSGYTSRLDAGTSLQAVVPNLTADSNYFFYVVAYAADGSESAPSNQIQYRPPVLTRVQVSPFVLGIMKIQFRGPAGASCHAQYATKLNPPDWQNLASNNASATDGSVTIYDAGARGNSVRFYRAAYP